MVMIWVLVVVLLVYVGILLAVAWISLHPLRTPIFVSPGYMGAPQELVEFDGEAGKLRGWWVESENPRGVIVLAHGYLMNRAELTPVAVDLWRSGFSCLLLDQRAHGKSDGRACSLGYAERRDVAAALKYVRNRCPGVRVGALGSSMGSAASALAVADDPSLADFLVIDSGYSKLSSAITGWWHFLGGRVLQILLTPTVFVAAPMAGFNPFGVDIAEAFSRMGPKPVLFLHGTADTLARPAEAERNAAACTGPTSVIWFEGYQHSEFRWEQPERYLSALHEFLNTHC